jgi:HSP20 family protein
MATVVRWDPFRELATLQNEMSRFMNGVFDNQGRTEQSWVPAVDVWETDDELVYAFDLPGIGEESIRADYRDGVLEVHVAKPEQPKPRRIEVGMSSGEPKTIEGSSQPTS